VVTTIHYPTRALQDIQRQSKELAAELYLVGDRNSPADFSLPGSHYLDLTAQASSGFAFAAACPTGHYARKNIGYLAAMRDGADIIIETDDDNIPLEAFWQPRQRHQTAPLVTRRGWCNAYGYFTSANIWPRGFPLDRLREKVSPAQSLKTLTNDCPIQQGLVDENPDVDAIYRLMLPLPINFEQGRKVILDQGVWCPFNSQNTTFWREAFPLLYLPCHCSFRMTDIWRSFVAQRLAWEMGWRLQFHSSTMLHKRNEHELMRDFADEVPGYLQNARIGRCLEDLPLRSGRNSISDNLVKAYEALVRLGVIAAEELPLVRIWLDDFAKL